MKAIEVAATVDTEQHRLTINHERAAAVAERGRGDPRIALGPVVAVAGPYLLGKNGLPRSASRCCSVVVADLREIIKKLRRKMH
jgi:hypothetical protein